MSDQVLISSLRKWMTDELPYISKEPIALEDRALNKLCLFKIKNVVSFIVKHICQRSKVNSIRKCLKTYSNWTNSETNESEENDHSKLPRKDLLLKQMWDSTAKVLYLKNKVQNLENEYVYIVTNLKTANECVDKDRLVCSLLIQTHHFLKEKDAFYHDATMVIQDIFQEMLYTGDHSSIPLLSHHLDQESSSANKLYDHLVLLTNLTNFQRILQNKEANEHDKERIWLDIRKILTSYVSQDILLCFQNQQGLNMNDLSFQTNWKTSKPVRNFPPSMVEMRKLKTHCINFLFDIKAKTKELQSEETLMKLDTNEEGLVLNLTVINYEIKVIMECCKIFREMIAKWEAKRKAVRELYVDKESKILEQLNAGIKQIDTKKSEITDLIRQNEIMICHFPKKQTELFDFATKNIQPQKILLNRSAEKLDFVSLLQRNILSLNQTVYNRHVTNKNKRQLLDSMHLLPFQNEHVLLNSIIGPQNDRMQQLVALRKKILEKRKCPQIFTFLSELQTVCASQRNEEQEALKPWVSKISTVLELHESDLVLTRIETNLQDWWEQPAQFIPDIMVKDLTLKQFITYLKL